MSEEIDVHTVYAEVQKVSQILTQQNKTFTARAEIDDARSAKLDRRIDALEDRIDAHGNRTTKVETQFTAFCGEHGAFNSVLNRLDQNHGLLLDLIRTVGVREGEDKAKAKSDAANEKKAEKRWVLLKVTAKWVGGLIPLAAILEWLRQHFHLGGR